MLSHAIPRVRRGSRIAAHRRAIKRWLDKPIQFMGTHQSRFDAKGRMSVPASFRAALRAVAVDGTPSLILRPSHTLACIEAWPVDRFERMAAGMDRVDSFSEDQDDLATTLYADAWAVEPDKEGRIVVPESLVQHAGLVESVVFMGLGTRFHIWEPAAAQQRKMIARQGTVTRGLTVPAVSP